MELWTDCVDLGFAGGPNADAKNPFLKPAKASFRALAAADGVKGFGSSDCEHSTVEIVPAPSDTSAVAANVTDFLLVGEVDDFEGCARSLVMSSGDGGVSPLMTVDRTSRPGWASGCSFTFKASVVATGEEDVGAIALEACCGLSGTGTSLRAASSG
jgi:hypothetical protein